MMIKYRLWENIKIGRYNLYTIDQSFGYIIRRHRLDTLKHSLQRVSNDTGINMSTINRLEHGLLKFNHERIAIFAKFLNMTEEDFIHLAKQVQYTIPLAA